MHWLEAHEGRQQDLARKQRLHKAPWQDDWTIRKQRLERERDLTYENRVIPFQSFVDLFLKARSEFAEVAAFGFCGVVGEYILNEGSIYLRS
jgi:hypothetical protein